MAKLCPLIKKECLEHGCRWYVHLMGGDPQSGRQIDEWSCAVEWLPVLLIENAKEVRQGAAAVETLRNENVVVGKMLTEAIAMAATARLDLKDGPGGAP